MRFYEICHQNIINNNFQVDACKIGPATDVHNRNYTIWQEVVWIFIEEQCFKRINLRHLFVQYRTVGRSIWHRHTHTGQAFVRRTSSYFALFTSLSLPTDLLESSVDIPIIIYQDMTLEKNKISLFKPTHAIKVFFIYKASVTLSLVVHCVK